MAPVSSQPPHLLVPVPVCGGGLYDKALREQPSQALREKMGLFGSRGWPRRGHIYSSVWLAFYPDTVKVEDQKFKVTLLSLLEASLGSMRLFQKSKRRAERRLGV